MFEENYSSYKNIISNIAILGYAESDIISRGINTTHPLELTCLFSYPSPDEFSYNQMTYDMMFPDKNYNIECPKFFSLNLTNEKGDRSYLYCLKFTEKYVLEYKHKEYEINIPLVLCIKSKKSDLEPFKKLLTSINQIIVSENIDYEPSVVNNYKKVELLNIFYFIFSLPHTPPHSLVRLKLNNDLCEVEKEIDFYFSSNCEIPCNQNDTDINLLFLLLDQSIIIKVILAILAEKQIIFIASQAYILHLIIPTFLKLIFPFHWKQSLSTLLPNEEAEDYLDMPGSFIFGVLSSAFRIKDIIKKFPGKIIVDCDTNEIFGEEEKAPFVPEKGNEEIINKKKKDWYNNIEGGIKQGKNVIIVDGSYIYQYDPNINTGKGKKMKFVEKNDIIIDTQNSQFLVNKYSNFITSSEIKWLRRNIQMVRNPEIFDIENITINNLNISKSNNFKDSESIILPNRPFSYNIQNILMHFYLNKISDEKSEFMEYFKNSNLYSSYLESKKYQNNSGKRIIENIKETKNNQRSIDNCFIVEFNKNKFEALSLIDEMDKKISEIKNDEKNNDIYVEYRKLKKILMDYCLVLGIKINNTNNNKINNNTLELVINDLNKNKTQIRHNKNPKKKGHIKSSSSILQFTSNQNTNFNLAGVDKSSKDYFKFYKKDGFLDFIQKMNELFKKDNKNLGDIHRMEIFKELINKYKTLENIFKEQKEEENEVIIDVLNENFEEEENEINEIKNEINEINEIKNGNNKLNKNQTLSLLEEIQVSSNLSQKKLTQIDENEEDNNDSFIEKKSVKNSADAKDNDTLGNIILNGMKLGGEYSVSQSQNDDNSNVYKSDNIIVFPENENKSENFINFEGMNQIKPVKNKNLTQYYLFLAFYLEEISHLDDLLDKFNKEIIQSVGITISIDKLILKLYKEAYKYSGEKHRDFPYYSFYCFLDGLNGKTLVKIERNLSEEDYNFSELLDIYEYIMNKKNIKIYKEEKKNDNVDNMPKRSNSTSESNYQFPFKNPDEKKENMNRTTHKENDLISRTEIYSLTSFLMEEDNFNKENIINIEFEPVIKPKSLHIINEFCTLMFSCFPSAEDIKTKSPQQILEEIYILVNSPGLKEFLGEIKYVDLNMLKTQIDKLCFWLNCFNFLLLFTIFYLKPFVINKNLWERIFKNIKYNIGGKNFSFEDMLYILFKKNIFFPKNKYTPNNYVKKNVVDISKAKNIDQDLAFISPLLLYIPTKEFYKPIIYEQNEIQGLILARMTNSIFTMIKWNANNKTLTLNGLLIIEDNFINKGYEKYKPFIKEEIYNVLKGKKYKKMALKQMNWELSFDNLLEYTYLED